MKMSKIHMMNTRGEYCLIAGTLMQRCVHWASIAPQTQDPRFDSNPGFDLCSPVSSRLKKKPRSYVDWLCWIGPRCEQGCESCPTTDCRAAMGVVIPTWWHPGCSLPTWALCSWHWLQIHYDPEANERMAEFSSKLFLQKAMSFFPPNFFCVNMYKPAIFSDDHIWFLSSAMQRFGYTQKIAVALYSNLLAARVRIE